MSRGPTAFAAATARVLRLADLPATPWKNGGGTTVEYAVFPKDAGLDGFDWRVSRTRVTMAGAFSIFPDVDRTLVVVAGRGIDLVFADRVEQLDDASTPLAFAAGVAVDGRPLDGPIEDLNVMTRRSGWRHRVEALTIPVPTRFDLADDVAFVVARTPLSARLPEADDIRLAAGDALRLDGPTAGLVLAPDGHPGRALLVTLARTRQSAA